MLATDPAAHLDIGVFIDKSKHEMLLYERENDVQYFYIQIAD
jgi:tRNA 2-thiouridine synthesizing protein A